MNKLKVWIFPLFYLTTGLFLSFYEFGPPYQPTFIGNFMWKLAGTIAWPGFSILLLLAEPNKTLLVLIVGGSWFEAFLISQKLVFKNETNKALILYLVY